jgi:hypothetical protein
VLTHPSDPQVKTCRAKYFAKSVHKVRSRRGVSLFEKIPADRDCNEAMVPFVYCNCKNQVDLTRNESLFISNERASFVQVGGLIVDKLNSIVDVIREKCTPFKLESVDMSG